jgi:hypothetical protein
LERWVPGLNNYERCKVRASRSGAELLLYRFWAGHKARGTNSVSVAMEVLARCLLRSVLLCTSASG